MEVTTWPFKSQDLIIDSFFKLLYNFLSINYENLVLDQDNNFNLISLSILTELEELNKPRCRFSNNFKETREPIQSKIASVNEEVLSAPQQIYESCV